MTEGGQERATVRAARGWLARKAAACACQACLPLPLCGGRNVQQCVCPTRTGVALGRGLRLTMVVCWGTVTRLSRCICLPVQAGWVHIGDLGIGVRSQGRSLRMPPPPLLYRHAGDRAAATPTHAVHLAPSLYLRPHPPHPVWRRALCAAHISAIPQHTVSDMEYTRAKSPFLSSPRWAVLPLYLQPCLSFWAAAGHALACPLRLVGRHHTSVVLWLGDEQHWQSSTTEKARDQLPPLLMEARLLSPCVRAAALCLAGLLGSREASPADQWMVSSLCAGSHWRQRVSWVAYPD